MRLKFTQSSSRFLIQKKIKHNPQSLSLNIQMWERAENTVLFLWAAKEKHSESKRQYTTLSRNTGEHPSLLTHINLF